MQCPSCDHPVADESRFCSSCGYAFTEASGTDPPDAFSRIDSAVDAFEKGELQAALDILDEELERSGERRDEVALIYLLDVSRQMLATLRDSEFEDLAKLVSDVQKALDGVQEGALPEGLQAAHETFRQDDHPAALEFLYRELLDASVPDDDSSPLALWRVFAVASEMANTLDR